MSRDQYALMNFLKKVENEQKIVHMKAMCLCVCVYVKKEPIKKPLECFRIYMACMSQYLCILLLYYI